MIRVVCRILPFVLLVVCFNKLRVGGTKASGLRGDGDREGDGDGYCEDEDEYH